MLHLLSQYPKICSSRPAEMALHLESPAVGSRRLSVLVIVAGCAAYGFTLGMGRAPLMGVYVAIKLPLLILLTLTVNALLNGILAQVLGSGLSFRQTGSAILNSFALFSLIVGSLSPIAAYFTMNADFQTRAAQSHAIVLLLHVVVIAAAGVVANLRLFAALRLLLPHGGIARNVLLAWLLGNLFVGAQFSYLLRPFFGQPSLKIEFLRPDAQVGNFYNSVWSMSRHFLGASGAIGVLLAGFLILLLCIKKQTKPTRNP